MEYSNGVLSSTDLSGLKLDERDTMLMSLGTAAGGLQTFILRPFLNDPPPTSAQDIITSKSGIAAIVVGLSFIGVGVAARTEMIDFDKTIATLMLGYGISAIISLGLNVITFNAAVATATPRSRAAAPLYGLVPVCRQSLLRIYTIPSTKERAHTPAQA